MNSETRRFITTIVINIILSAAICLTIFFTLATPKDRFDKVVSGLSENTSILDNKYQSAVNSLQSSINTLKANDTSLQQGLTSSNTAIADTVKQFNTALANLTKQINTTNNDLQILRANLGTYVTSSDISPLTSELATLRTMLATYSARLDEYQTTINTLRNRITDLENGTAYNNNYKLIGYDDAAVVYPSYGGCILMQRLECVQSGDCNSIRLKCSNPAEVKVAIYSDNSGVPGTLLSQNSNGADLSAGWNTIGINSTSFVDDTYYWLAFIADRQLYCISASTGGTLYYKFATYSGFTFPSSAGTGYTASTIQVLIAGWE